MFSIQSSKNYQLLAFERLAPLKFLKFVSKIAGIICLASLLAIIFGLSAEISARIFFLFLAFFVFFWIFSLFSRFALRSQGEKMFLLANGSFGGLAENKAEFLGFESVKIISTVLAGSEIEVKPLILKLIYYQPFRFVFNRLGLKPKDAGILALEKISPANISSEKLVEQAYALACQKNHSQIEPHDLFLALVKLDQEISKLLFGLGIEEQDLAGALAWQWQLSKELEAQGRFWELENLVKGRGFGKKWAFGYTENLDKYSTDLTSILEETNPRVNVIGHTEEIAVVERTLARRGENNVLIVGDPGVGKSAVVLGFARLITHRRTSPSLAYKRVVQLDVSKILSGSSSAGEIQEKIETILYEALKAGNIILVIDKLPEFLSKSEAIGTTDLTSIFQKYFSSPNFQVIAVADRAGFHQHIESKPGFLEQLSVVEVKEPDQEKTLLILEEIVPALEKQYNCFILFQALRKIVEMSDVLISEIPFPEKAIQILQDMLAQAPQNEQKTALVFDAEAVAGFLSKRTGIPLKTAEAAEEKEKLLHLEELMHDRLVDQEEAVIAIAEALRRNRAGLSRQNRPIGNFLFLGPTGVGKTETARTLAQIYFGSEERMVRLDMSEYQNEESIGRLIGSQANQGQSVFVNKIKEQPFSLVLLDEIEKANPNVLNLFLRVLDEGRMTDVLGRRVSFNFSIIIATSNAGAEFIRQQINHGVNSKDLSKNLVDFVLKSNIFKPEFLNRFDAVVVYKPLNYEQIKSIAKMMLNNFAKRLKSQKYEFKYSEDLAEYLAKIGFDPVFGARAMRRTLDEKIEGLVARRILANKYEKGGLIELGLKDLEN